MSREALKYIRLVLRMLTAGFGVALAALAAGLCIALIAVIAIATKTLFPAVVIVAGIGGVVCFLTRKK